MEMKEPLFFIQLLNLTEEAMRIFLYFLRLKRQKNFLYYRGKHFLIHNGHTAGLYFRMERQWWDSRDHSSVSALFPSTSRSSSLDRTIVGQFLDHSRITHRGKTPLIQKLGIGSDILGDWKRRGHPNLGGITLRYFQRKTLQATTVANKELQKLVLKYQ